MHMGSDFHNVLEEKKTVLTQLHWRQAEAEETGGGQGQG